MSRINKEKAEKVKLIVLAVNIGIVSHFVDFILERENRLSLCSYIWYNKIVEFSDRSVPRSHLVWKVMEIAIDQENEQERLRPSDRNRSKHKGKSKLYCCNWRYRRLDIC